MLQGVDPSVCGDVSGLTDQQILEARYCYCPLPVETPSMIDKVRNMIPGWKPPPRPPEGFCGHCQVCRKPGHVCHYPGPLPFTGCWCDEHYIKEVREKPMLKAADEYFNGTHEEPTLPNFKKKDT